MQRQTPPAFPKVAQELFRPIHQTLFATVKDDEVAPLWASAFNLLSKHPINSASLGLMLQADPASIESIQSNMGLDLRPAYGYFATVWLISELRARNPKLAHFFAVDDAVPWHWPLWFMVRILAANGVDDITITDRASGEVLQDLRIGDVRPIADNNIILSNGDALGFAAASPEERKAMTRLVDTLEKGKPPTGRRPDSKVISPEAFPLLYLDAYNELRTKLQAEERLPTQSAVAGRMGIGPATLRRYLQQSDLKYPPY